MKQIILYILLLPTILLSAPGKLNGTYKVGGSGSDFATIADAVDSLYLAGIDGPVTFLLGLNSYNEQIDLNGAISGSSAANTVTFESQGNPNNVEVHYSATSSSDNFVIRINSARHIIFNSITFTAGGTDYSRVVLLQNTNGDLNFTNNILNGYNAPPGYSYSSNNDIVYCNSGNLNNTVVESNEINFGYNALYLNFGSQTSGLEITNNNISTISSNIYLRNVDSPLISGNNLECNLNASIDIDNCQNGLTIEKNKIDGNTGIKLFSVDGVLWNYAFVKNNFIRAFNIGIDITGSEYINTYFNSVNIDGTPTNINSAGIKVNTTIQSTNLNVLNNIVVNKREGYALHDENGQISNIDYNNYYTNGNNLVKWNGVDYPSLSLYNSSTGLEPNSYQEEVEFISSTDLHIVRTPYPLYGNNITSITADIDGSSRNNPPAIGAHEYINPLGGTYTIGNTGNFNTFQDAINALYSSGVDNPVIFNVQDGNYNEQIEFYGDIWGSSSTNTITLQSLNNDPSKVEVSFSNPSSANYVLKIEIAKFIKIKNITFTTLNFSYARVFLLDGAGGDLEITGNILNGYSGTFSTSSSNYNIVEGSLNNTIFESNQINNGSIGIDGNGSNLQIINNIIDTYSIGINVAGDALKINSNTITNETDYGIRLSNDNDFVIEKNIISGNNGIELHYCDGSPNPNGNVVNNFIHANGLYGINIANSTSINVQFNNINIYDPNLTNNTSSAALSIIGSSSIIQDVSNNIMINRREGYTINEEFSVIISSDYNNLYTTGTTLVKNGSTDYTTLTAWQAAPEGFDANSYSEDVTFVSSTDLHIASTPVPLNGTTIPSITTDIDGETRWSPPFIGADEPTGTNVSIKLYLEGPYNNNNMNATLTLPLASPYSADPVTVSSIPTISGNEVVDWVLVELREKNNSSMVLESQSAFILQDGSIVDTDGSSPVHFTQPSEYYYIAVKHRNHLGVMSASTVKFN